MTDVRPKTLKCKDCGKWKRDDAFYRHGDYKRRRCRNTICIPCMRTYNQRYKRNSGGFERLWARLADKAR